ncbi:RNA-directed DNA polymerase [Aneurinibacillus sp. REN35]|uniref:RNA-directed DNA polymerase n=1 Tax=Aneurinibacillus sp. REN35 TaxID=3237286 RepID=UPI003528FB1B
MYKNFTYSTLESYFNYLKPTLKVGLDRISADNYESNLEENLNIILRKVKNRTYKFTKLKQVTRNNRTVNIPTIRDRILIEYLKDKIKQKYKIKPKNRNDIINNLINILSEDIDYYVIKIDINNFFPSISINELKQKFETSSLLQANEYYIFTQLLNDAKNGLPQGLSISNYLSELFLENLDMKLKRVHPRILLYSRYVDDIILVITGKLNKNEKVNLQKYIEKIFISFNLQLNRTKTKYIELLKGSKSDMFEYLGYSFQRLKKNKTSNLNINISKSKLKKYYKKIDYYIYDFRRNPNIDLLFERLVSFTSINKISKQKIYLRKNTELGFKKSNITFGLIEDYKFANDDSFKKIDTYLTHKIYHLKVKYGNNFSKLHSLSAVRSKQKQKLINFNKIPLYTVRSKVYKMDKNLTYRQVLSMDKKTLLQRYFNLLQLKKD